MNERQMRYLQTIAAEGTLAKAAAAGGKNLSTMTRALKSCEEELGLQLFRRSGTGLLLTSEGEAILRQIDGLLAEMDQLPHVPEKADRGKIPREHSWTETDLKYLLSIREHGNISAAAEECYIAQPSLSQKITELEKQLGQRIFTRSKYGVQETAFGRDLLDRLERIRGLYQELDREVEELQELKTGIITIGIPMNLGTYLLPRILPDFAARYPSIQIKIRENNSRELERLLHGNKIDFAILHLDEEDRIPPDSGIEIFAEDPFCLVVPKTLQDRFRFSGRDPVPVSELKELDGAPFIMVTRQQKLRDVADRILADAGIRPTVRCSTRNMETAKRLTAAGMGITILPRSYLDLYSDFAGMESYHLDPALHASWKLAVAYPGSGQLSRLSAEFLGLLRQTF